VTAPGTQPWGYAGTFADPDGHVWMGAVAGPRALIADAAGAPDGSVAGPAHWPPMPLAPGPAQSENGGGLQERYKEGKGAYHGRGLLKANRERSSYDRARCNR
jgi:sugar lactone lactonase YvrE